MSAAAAPLRPLPADLDRARHAARLEAELEHVGTCLDDWEWCCRSGVRVDDLVGDEARAILEAIQVLGENCRGEGRMVDVRTLASEIERRDDLLSAMTLAEHDRGRQSVVSRLLEIRVARGTFGQEARLARAILRQAREDRLRALHRRGATGEDVVDDLVVVRGEIESIESGGASDRFSEAATRVAFVFESRPKRREMLFDGFLPAGESGLVAARGGGGKGHLQQAVALSLTLGDGFAGYRAPSPRGIVIVSAEDDLDEIHRRMYSALEARFGARDFSEMKDVRSAIERRIRVVDLRGTVGIGIGRALRDRVLRVVERVEAPGLVWLDPLSRLLPPGSPPGFLNSQEGAGLILSEMDALRSDTGCTVLASHHVAKDAIRTGAELTATAATGSLQLVDLSRWVLGLKPLSVDEAAAYGLRDGHFVEAAVAKSNYTPPIEKALVFQRVAGGALVHVEAKVKSADIDEKMLSALISAEAWLTREAWNERASELSGIAKHKADGARTRLLATTAVESVEVREGRRSKLVFGPSDRIRMDRWPKRPQTLREVEGAE